MKLYCCTTCNGVFRGAVEPGFDHELYAYYEKYEGQSFEEVYSALNRIRCRALLDRFAQLADGRAALDVGCGKGDFVHAAIQEGWDCRGIDLAERAIAVGRRFGLPVSCQDFFSPEIGMASCDLVTLFEVIEHVSNPADFLVRAEQVAKPGGLVYLTTPNFASLDRRVLGPAWKAIHTEHLTYFTPRSLLDLVRRHTTFETLDVETRNLSVELTQKLLGTLAGRRRTSFGAGGHPEGKRSNNVAGLRETIEASVPLRGLKHIANRVLSATGLGTTMTVLLRRTA